MSATLERTEGFVDVGPGRVWYESAGDGPAILLLHGGPGASSDYMVPLMDLAEDGFRVVRFDQLGSRRSDKPDDVGLWVTERFVEEVERVRQALDLGRFHLIGQSWGAFLGLEYALAYQQNLASLTLYSGAASTRQCVDGMNALRAQMPPEAIAIMDRFEATGETDNPEYLAAIETLYKRHLCRLDPFPPLLQESMEHNAVQVYTTMWGANEFTCTGNLLSLERRDQLGEITVPTLILCGRYDEVVPECSETMHSGIVGSELTIFEHSSHLAHFEEPDAFYPVLRDFLARNRTGA